MANKYCAEIEIELDGRTRLLRFDCNTLADIETELGESAIDRLNEMQRSFEAGHTGRIFSCIRAFLWAGLHATNKGIKIETVGKSMSTDMASLGAYLKACTSAIASAIGSDSPEAQEAVKKAKEIEADPLASVEVTMMSTSSTSPTSGEKPSSAG